MSALIIFVTRVALGYKQTWDRYEVRDLCFPLLIKNIQGKELSNVICSSSPLSTYIKIPHYLQLLVNRTLYEKTLASGFGSVYFLLDASEQQQVSRLLYFICL